MQNKQLFIIVFILVLLLSVTIPANAQTDTPLDGTPEGRIGEVKGKIVNRSPGASISEGVDVMLHIWDQNYNGKGMLHGQSEPDGSFHFTDVSFEPNLLYAVMANYEGASYFSEPVILRDDETTLEFDVPIYETTTDLSKTQLDQVHVIFFFEQGGLKVAELYILSNLGEYTVKDAVKLDNGLTATLKFSLPENAANVSFNSNDNNRFVQYSGGFADTSPLVPGVSSTRIILDYVLPYDDEQSYTFIPPLVTNEVKFLIIQDPGIKFEGDELVFDGTQTMQDGTTLDVYTHEGLQPNEILEVSISGRPTNSVSGMIDEKSLSPKLPTSGLEIGIGGILLGLALVVVGMWWWRKPTDIHRNEEEAGPDQDELVTGIILPEYTVESGDSKRDELAIQEAVLQQQVKTAVRGEDKSE